MDVPGRHMERERRRGCRAECKLEREKSCPLPPERTPGPPDPGTQQRLLSWSGGWWKMGVSLGAWPLFCSLGRSGNISLTPVPQKSVNARETSRTFSAWVAVWVTMHGAEYTVPLTGMCQRWSVLDGALEVTGTGTLRGCCINPREGWEGDGVPGES